MSPPPPRSSYFTSVRPSLPHTSLPPHIPLTPSPPHTPSLPHSPPHTPLRPIQSIQSDTSLLSEPSAGATPILLSRKNTQKEDQLLTTPELKTTLEVCADSYEDPFLHNSHSQQAGGSKRMFYNFSKYFLNSSTRRCYSDSIVDV